MSKRSTSPGEPLRNVQEHAMRSMDTAAKQILSHLPLLAFIMQNTIAEFRGCTLEEIVNTYIKPNIQVGSTAVNDRGVRSPLGFGMRNESNSSEEGNLYYDILFGARLPNRTDEVGIIINIEPQANPNPGYPLLKRAQYYCARMLSAQRATWPNGSDYGRLEKVYSIWLCTNPPKGMENTITEYVMGERMIQGRGWRDPSEYDLQSILMICLPEAGEYTVFTEALATILSPVTGVDVKMKALETHLGAKLARDFEDEVADMEGIGEYAVRIGIEKGMQQGLEQGLKEGHEKGLKIGLEQGMQQGIQQGIQQGMQQGIQQGIEEGLQQGLEKGLEEGLERGVEQAELSSIKNLMETLNLDAQRAMDALRIPNEKRERYRALIDA